MPEHPKHSTPQALFEQAHCLWYDKGYTSRALALYRRFAEIEPNHPAGLLQMARTSWSMGSFDEAQAWVDKLVQQKHHLTEDGRGLLELTRDQLLRQPSTWNLVNIPSRDLDMERLEKERFSSDMWIRIGLAAKAWRIYGVALRALQRGNGTVRHLVRDIDEVEHNLFLHRSLLKVMESAPV